MWQRVRAAPPAVILALAALVVFVYAYPGQMTEEATSYLRQARSHFYSDAYAPAVSALWRLLEMAVAGPTAMLLVQLAAWTIGVYAIVGRAWPTAALAVFPPLLVGLAVISDHAVAAGALALGAGALLHGRRRAGFAALALATLLRPSALVATVPLVWLAWPRQRRYLAAGVAWFALTAAALGGDAILARGRTFSGVARPQVAQVLWLDGFHADAAVPPRVAPAGALKLGVPTRSSELQDTATAAVAGVARWTPLFAPWLYLIAAGALAWLARRHRDLLALLASGVAYELAVVATADGPAPGQSVWLVTCTGIVALALVARRRTA